MALTHQVYKSNALIEASYRLTSAEQGIILSCISQIQRLEKITDQITYEISVESFIALTKANPSSAYRLIKKAAMRLWERGVTLSKKPNGEGDIKNKDRRILTRWIQSVDYHDSQGKVSLRFSHEILPYITNLTKCFTKYNLKNVARMSSGYGIRLYEIFAQWGNIGEKEVSIEWLKSILQIDEKYKSIKDFKKRVIEPAIDDINQFSDLNAKWKQRKTGRKVTHLIFEFSLKEEQKAKAKKPEIKIQGIKKSIIEKYAKPGETYEQAGLRLKKSLKGV